MVRELGASHLSDGGYLVAVTTTTDVLLDALRILRVEPTGAVPGPAITAYQGIAVTPLRLDAQGNRLNVPTRFVNESVSEVHTARFDNGMVTVWGRGTASSIDYAKLSLP